MLTPLARAYFGKLAKQVESAAMEPQAAQKRVLARLLPHVLNNEAARRLPVTEYSVLKPGIESLYCGQAGQTRERILAFAQTSGSTAAPKRYPITPAFVRSYQRSTVLMNASFFHTTGEWDSLFHGKRLILAARPVVERSPSGHDVGFMTGIMAMRTPAWVRKHFLPGPDVLKLSTWEEKIERILKDARSEDVRMIGGVPPLVLTFTERALKKYGVRSLSEVWPGLGVLLYGGVALSSRMKAGFTRNWQGETGRKLFFWEMYAATEGQFGHTFHPDWPGMVFNTLETFFQFTEYGSQATESMLQLHELERGKRYVVYVTTAGGLVNYRMGDVVEILSTRPLTFRVSGRESEELSLNGEKITPDQLESAVQLVSSERQVGDYVVWAEEGTPSRLIWALASDEVRGVQPAGTGPGHERLAQALDQALSQVNPTYREMRVNDFLYRNPGLYLVSKDVFESYRARHLDQGQFKGKRLFQSRDRFEQTYGIHTQGVST